MNEALAEYGTSRHQKSYRFLSKLSEITKKSGKPTQILMYNQALTNFHLKRFAAAMTILENLFEEIESASEELALRICFLLLEMYFYSSRGLSSKTFLESKEYKKMMKVIAFLEKSSSKDSKEFKFRLHLMKTKIQLRIESTKQVKKEVKAALDLYEEEIKAHLNDPPAVKSGCIRPSDSMWWCLPGTTRDCMPTFLKANMEYARSNMRKTIRHLTNAKRKGVDESLYFNGMGCAHFQLKAYDTAASYFARSLDATASESKERKSSGATVKKSSSSNIPSHERRCAEITSLDVMYNSGLSLLKCNRPKLAFRCFRRASSSMHRDPLVWIRMAECCIAGWKKRRLSSNERTSQAKGTNFRRVVGVQSARRVLLPLSTREGDDEERDGEEKDGEEKDMTMAYARTCLRNALILLQDGDKEKKRKNNKSSGGAEGKDTILIRTALLDSIFVSLCVSDHVEALRVAREFLKRRDITDKQRCFASFYAAEALCCMDRASEATKQLTGTPLIASKFDIDDKIRAGYHVNVAKTYILQSDLKKAEKCANQALNYVSRFPEAVRILTYIKMRSNSSERALGVLRATTTEKAG